MDDSNIGSHAAGLGGVHAGLGARIKKLADILGGKKEMARVANVSEVQIYRYINEENTPSVSIIVTLARAAGVSIEWLATGVGPMAPAANRGGGHGGGDAVARIDVPLLAGVLRRMDRVIKEEGVMLDIPERANIVARLYSDVSEAVADTESRLKMAETVMRSVVGLMMRPKD